MEFAAKLHGMAAALPRIRIADFNRGVPCVHGRGRERITDSCVALRGEPGGTPSVLAPKPDSLNTQRANDVVGSIILRGAVHRKPRECKGNGVDSVARKHVVP